MDLCLRQWEGIVDTKDMSLKINFDGKKSTATEKYGKACISFYKQLYFDHLFTS